MLTVNTNVTSLGAQRTLNNSTSSLSSSLQRLSSGLRINSAKDDAAGLSIASRMTAQIRGVGQAIRNANDGISVAQTAEGGLTQVGDMLQRMRELAVQSANGSNSAGDRKTIQNEISQLYEEIDRISGATEFNGQKLFSGNDALNDKSFQIGANSNQTISYKIGEISTKTLGLNSSVADGQAYSGRVGTLAPNDGDLVINGKAVDFAAAGADNTIAKVEAAINASSSVTGVSVDAFNKLEGTSATVSSSKLVSGLTIKVGAGAAVTIDDSSSLEQLAENINKQVGGVTATIGDKGNLVLSNDTGDTIDVGGTTANSGLSAGSFTGMLAFKSADGADINFSTSSGTPASQLNQFGLNASSGNGSVSSSGSITAAVGQAATITAMNAAGVYDPTTNTTDVVKINGVAVGKASSQSAADGAAAINAIKGQTGVSAAAKTEAAFDLDFANVAGDITINGTTITLTAADSDVAKVVTAINASGIQGVVAEADTTTGRLVLRSDTGADILMTNGAVDGTGGTGFVTKAYDSAAGTNATAVAATGSVGIRGKITLTADDGGSVRVDGDGSATGGTGLAKFGLVAQNGDDNVVGGGLNVMTVASANKAMEAIDKAINKVNEKRSELGAVQNRFSNTISNLQISSENLSASRSRIQDADFAAETAALSRNQILQQAGTAMLAQANQLPQQVMQLLR